ncbi:MULTISPECIES: hypothetical protein [Bacillus]|uniref:hypothetical protein n=1 Tax=Bacillus TaxID=1386 RepID=UPI00036818AB|nr:MULTISPECIES: hypothetical protein [Bacillus]
MNSLLKKSKETRAPIMIFYISKANEVTQRIVTVKSISKTCIRAYCHFRKAERIFKIDSILSCGRIGKRSA